MLLRKILVQLVEAQFGADGSSPIVTLYWQALRVAGVISFRAPEGGVRWILFQVALSCTEKSWWMDEGGVKTPKNQLGGGFKYFLFSPLVGEDSHFD